jgi:hypothetical protein
VANKTENHFNSVGVIKLVIYFCKAVGQGRLPGKAAGQGCRARLPGKAAGQGCRARLPGKAAGQSCRTLLPGKAAGQKSRFEKNQSNQEPYLICLFSFSESTCSGVSKTENHFDVHAL